MLSAFCGFGSCRVNDPLAGAVSRNIGLVAALALMPVVGVVILPICAVAVGMAAACCGDRCGFKNLLADGAFLMLSAFCVFGSCRVNDPLAGAVSRFVLFVVATRTFVPVVCRIVFPIRTICMTESSIHRYEGICCADCTAGAALEIYCVACAVSRGFKCFWFYSFLIIGVRMWSVLVGRFHTYCTCRHSKCCGCAVCVCKGNAAAYNFPLIKYLAGRSCTCGQSNSCTHCCLGDRSACTNGCSTACHGYIVLNSFPNCGYGSVSSNGNLVANCLFTAANAPSLELLTGRSSKAVCRERIFAGNAGDICHCACTAVRVKAHSVGRGRGTLWLIGSNAGILIHIGVVCIGSKARGGRKKRRAINLAFPFDRHLADLRQGQSAHRINAIAVSLIACLVYIDLNRAIGVDGHTRIAINAVAGV